MKRFEIALAIGIVIAICVGSFSSFAQEWDDIRHEVVRLHILANSDSEEDQALKIAVRDAVLAETAELFREPQDKEGAESLASEHLEEIQAVAEGEVRRRGCDDPVRVQLVNRYFDTRVYEGFTMPAGRYDAVQIEIGAGDGQNWWCVMFPPMCIPAASDREGLPLEDQIRELGQPPRYKPAFAVVEAIEEIQERFAE